MQGCLCLLLYDPYAYVFVVLELDRKVSAVGGDASSISSQIRKKRFESFNLLWLKETTTVDDETEHEYGAGIGNHKEMYHGGQDQNMDVRPVRLYHAYSVAHHSISMGRMSLGL